MAFVTTSTIWNKLFASTLARNSVLMGGGSAIRLVLQAIYFVLVARALGPSQYGAFVGAVALIAIASPFASLGFGGILIKHTARDSSRFPEAWGNALWMTGAGGALLLPVVLAIAHFAVGGRIPFALVLLLALADLFCAPLVGLAGQAFQAFERLDGTASTVVALGLLRTLGAVLFALVVDHPDATSWAVLYLAGSAIAALYAVSRVCRELGTPKIALKKLRPDLAEGSFFAIGASSQTIYNDLDKTMLVRLADLSAAGIYATAYRLVDTAFQPVSAVLHASYARFFKAGSNGVQGTLRIALWLLPYLLTYGAAAAVILVVIAPLVPFVLGRDFSESVPALRWLAVLLMIRPIHYMAANALTGADLQGLRAAVQVAVAGVNIGLNLWLIPLYSWRGAAWASLISDGILAVSLWGTVLLFRRTRKVALREAQTRDVYGVNV
jgi:O-antigen/teichoic acid export membrane protein